MNSDKTIDEKTSNPVRYKIHPSSSGFVTDNGLEISYNSACPRYIVASQGVEKKPIDPIYQQLGALHEDQYAEELGSAILHKELVIKEMLTPITQYSGRVDFVTKDGIIHELKASLSKNFLYSVIRKKIVKLSHLAQTVSYMIRLQQERAVIVAGFYRENFTKAAEHRFVIEIEDSGDILADQDPTGYSVKNQLDHLNLVVSALESRAVTERPSNSGGWDSPCRYCPMRSVCDMYDAGMYDKEQLFALGAIEVANDVPKPFKFSGKKSV